MNSFKDGLSPDRSPCKDIRLQRARDFWIGLSELLDNVGETHRGLLEGLKVEYEDILSREPIDLNKVDSLTAEAAILLLGNRKF